jgi:hypothetical protein
MHWQEEWRVPAQDRDSTLANPYSNDPERNPVLFYHSKEPCNAEPPAELVHIHFLIFCFGLFFQSWFGCLLQYSNSATTSQEKLRHFDFNAAVELERHYSNE